MKILLIDNYDSFTYNLYHLLALVSGGEPVVVVNDRIDPETIVPRGFTHIVISPGPGRPEKRRDFGLCGEILSRTQLPLLGVCLGFQGLVYTCGGQVIPAPEPIHGRTSDILHQGDPLFRELPHCFSAVRYHSLTVAEPLPQSLVVIARTAQGLPMAIRHRERPLVGVQFHPESIGTQYGRQLVANFLGETPSAKVHLAGGRGKRTVVDRSPLRPHFRKLSCFFDAERVFTGLFGEKERAFWLDSSLDGAGRFSYMGCEGGPHGFFVKYGVETGELVLEKDGERSCRSQDIWRYLDDVLRHWACEESGLPCDFIGGFIGYFGYELKAECGGERAHRSPHPDAGFLFVDRFLVLDHQERCVYLVALAGHEEGPCAGVWFDQMERAMADLPAPAALTGPLGQSNNWHLARSRVGYLADIRNCLDAIGAGESYEVCLTNRLLAEPVRDALALYRRLRHINPAPYAAWLRLDNLAVLCSSPELFLRIDREGRVTSKPIKGTRARLGESGLDEAEKRILATSVKDRSENLMIVDLVRNDLGRVCQVGSIRVPRLMAVESYATVHQLVSTVSGRLRPECTVLDCIRAAFPGGSMTGAPKRRTMEIIDKLETSARGIYSGSLGYLSLNGTAELNIVIRTLVADCQAVSAGIGGAIVALSDPETEFEEALLKGAALIRATENTTPSSLHSS